MRTTFPISLRRLTPPVPARRRWALAAIEAVVGANALGGMAYALGGATAVPSEWLDDIPFNSYLIPGVCLGVMVGGNRPAAAYVAVGDATASGSPRWRLRRRW